MVGIKDVFIPDGGENRLFKPTYIRTFRYIQLDIETKDEALTLDNYYHVECRAPLDLKAEFSTGSELTDWIMDAGWRTVSLCAQDYLMSDAYYEQLQYVGDSRVHNLVLFTLSGDDRLTRNIALITHSDDFSLLSKCFYLVIPYSHLIDQIYDYMRRDDKALFHGLSWY